MAFNIKRKTLTHENNITGSHIANYFIDTDLCDIRQMKPEILQIGTYYYANGKVIFTGWWFNTEHADEQYTDEELIAIADKHQQENNQTWNTD